jgi:hypothetical protein
VPLCAPGEDEARRDATGLAVLVAMGKNPAFLHKACHKVLATASNDNSWRSISQAARDRNAAIEKQAQKKKSMLHHARDSSR